MKKQQKQSKPLMVKPSMDEQSSSTKPNLWLLEITPLVEAEAVAVDSAVDAAVAVDSEAADEMIVAAADEIAVAMVAVEMTAVAATGNVLLTPVTIPVLSRYA
jgi:hypothetical protein